MPSAPRRVTVARRLGAQLGWLLPELGPLILCNSIEVRTLVADIFTQQLVPVVLGRTGD